MKNKFLIIDSGYFIAGAVVVRGRVTVRRAPIIKYMFNWSLSKVREYCKYKAWDLHEIEETIAPDGLFEEEQDSTDTTFNALTIGG